MAVFVAPGKVKSNAVSGFVAPGKVKSENTNTPNVPPKKDPPKELVIPDGYFTSDMIDSLAKIQKISDVKKIQSAKDKLLSENRLRGTAQEADYWNRLSAARKAQETNQNAIFVSPVSVPFDTTQTKGATAKNVAKGFLDILDLPSRGVASLLTEQKITEPGAYAAKPVVDALLSEGLTSYGLEKAPLSPAERWVTETGGRFLSDPLNVLNPVKGVVIKGGKAVLAPIKTAKDIAKLAAGEKIDALKATGKSLLEILNPPSLTREIGKKGLKSQLNISTKDAENFARIVGKTDELVPSIAGRQAVVEEMLDKGLYSSRGYNKMLENVTDKLKKAQLTKKDILSDPNVYELVKKDPELLQQLEKQGGVTYFDDELTKMISAKMDALKKDPVEIFDQLKIDVRKSKDILPENKQMLQREIEKLQAVYTDPTVVRIPFTRGEGMTSSQLEVIRGQLGENAYKTPFIGAHPIKQQAKELSERAVAEAILKLKPATAEQNLDIRKMKALENIIKKTAESYDKGSALDRLASGEIVGSAVGSLSPITSRIPSTLLNIDYINRITGGSLPRNVATGLLNDERTKQEARKRKLKEGK